MIVFYHIISWVYHISITFNLYLFNILILSMIFIAISAYLFPSVNIFPVIFPLFSFLISILHHSYFLSDSVIISLCFILLIFSFLTFPYCFHALLYTIYCFYYSIVSSVLTHLSSISSNLDLYTSYSFISKATHSCLVSIYITIVMNSDIHLFLSNILSILIISY